MLSRLGVRRVLDMGCGDGWQARRLAQEGFQVIGSDVAPERLRRARALVPAAVGFFSSDMRAPAVSAGRLDCLYLGQVLEHLPEPASVLRALRDTLRPGGYLVLDTPCRDNVADRLLRLLRFDVRFPGCTDWALEMDPGHLWFFRRSEIRGLLESAGFRWLASHGAPHLRWNVPRVGNVLAERRSLWRLHDLVEDILGWIPGIRGTGAILVCVAQRPEEP